MTAKKDGLSRTPSVLCGELMERQEGVLFGGVRMVGSCFISNPALASITNEKAADPFKGGGLLVGSVSGRQASALGDSFFGEARRQAPPSLTRRRRRIPSVGLCGGGAGNSRSTK